MKKSNALLWCAAGLAATVMGLWAAGALSWPQGRAAQALPVAAGQVTRGSLRDVLIAKGSVAYDHQLSVRAQLSGRVAAVAVHEGSEVRRGQALLRVEDPQGPIDADLRALEERRARTRLDALEKDVATAVRLVEAGGLARFELDQKLLERDLARKDLERSAMESAKLAEQRRLAQLNSPLDGLVITRPVVVGQWVNAGDELMQLAGGAARNVVAHVDAMDIERLRVGGPVVFSDQEDGGRRRKGRIAEIARTVAPAQAQRQNAVKVIVQPLEDIGELRVSQQLYVEFVVLEEAQVLRVPKELVYADGAHQLVYVATPQGVRAQPVQTARGDASFDKVVAGLNGGEALVRRPAPAGDAR